MPSQKCATSGCHYNEDQSMCSGRWGDTRLILHVAKADGKVDGEYDQDDVRLDVGERSEPVVLLLTRRVPESELDELAIEVDEGDVVLEDGWDVCLCKGGC